MDRAKYRHMTVAARLAPGSWKEYKLRVMLLLLWDKQRYRVGIREQPWRCLWSPGDLRLLVFPVYVPWEDIIYLDWEFQLNLETWNISISSPSTSPDTHASSNLQQRLTRSASGHLQSHKFCPSLLSGERYAGHASCSRFPLGQTCSVIPICKVKRYFNIRWSRSESVFNFY